MVVQVPLGGLLRIFDPTDQTLELVDVLVLLLYSNVVQKLKIPYARGRVDLTWDVELGGY